MESYRHIVVAIDLTDASEAIAQKAHSLAQLHHATLSLVHVFEYVLPIDIADMPLGASSVFIDEPELKNQHEEQLAALAKKLKLDSAKQVVLEGIAKTQIVNYAQETQADLIIVGSHGRHGIDLLLGSTANAVLHHAPCDVLAIRIKNS